MARRFASSFVLASDPDTFKVNPFTISGSPTFATAAGGAVFQDDTGKLYIAPSCYSEVRKVIFWAVIRHEQLSGLSGIPVRLRVAPSSTSANTRNIESKNVNESTFTITQGTGQIWTIDEIDNEACLYSPQSSRQNSINTLDFATLSTPGSQVIYQEFHRFEAGDADFFDDWDTVVALGDDSRHIAYSVIAERTDGSTWTDAPVIVASGFAIVQAPSTSNNTRILIPATFGLYNPGAMSTTYGNHRACPFFYHADEWQGQFELRYVCRIHGTGGQTGNFSVKVSTVQMDSTVLTSLYEESFVRGVATDARSGVMARTADFAGLLTDGDVLTVQHKNDLAGTQNQPYGWWEITLKDFSRMVSQFSCGHPPALATTIPGGDPPPDTYGKSAGLIDPQWFEDMESFRFVSSKMQGGLRHVADNDSEQHINLNANLGADVSTSPFNTVMSPDLSSTPNATGGFKLRDSAITSTDPINLAGKRKLTEKFGGSDWSVGTDDVPGGMSLAYVIDVPNTDIVPLGPLFDVGAFNPEGCAATSAGLGEPPLLIITNGSTLPQKFNPTAAGTDGEVENASLQTPFEGEVPSTTPADAAASPDGGLNLGTYKYRYTFRNCCTGKESDPNPDDITVDTSGQAPAASVTLSFAGVRIPSDPQICEICIYRTVEGGDYPIMAKVGCFNVDEASLFVDDLSDDALDFTNDGLSILNGPMPCVPVVVDFRNRLFGMGDIPNLAPAGTVTVVNGSDIVTGSEDVEWDRCLEGKFIKVGADCRSYEILRVLPPDEGTSPPIGRLKLVDPYEGADDVGLTYTICGRPNRLYFSEPLEPEYWPAANFLDIEPGDGDRLMGAVSNFDSLVICKRRKTYILRFVENPGTEVNVPTRISSDIGCIGPRTFAQVESGSVWLADRGLALFDGRTVQHIEESMLMNDIFVDPDNPNYIRRDRNGRVIEAVGAFYPKRQQYLLLLPTVQTNRGCNLMLVWDTKLRNITLLKFCQEFLSMTIGKDSAGNERVYLGDTNGFVWIYDIGDTDGVGVPNATGTVRGTVTGAGLDPDTSASYLDDSAASFIEGGIPGLADLSGVAGLSGAFNGSDTGLAGVCVYTRPVGSAYDDPWTVRTVYAATLTRLYVTPQWGPDTPFDETGAVQFEYMLGPIELDLLFKPQNYGTDDMSKRDWRQIVVHEIENFASKLRVDLLPDFSSDDAEAETVVDPVTEDVGEGRVFRMDYSKGRQIKPVGRLVHWYMAVRLRNFAPEEPISVINHLLCMEPRVSK